MKLTHSWTTNKYYPILFVRFNKTHIHIEQKPIGTNQENWIIPITILTSNISMSNDVYWISENSLLIPTDSEEYIIIKPTIAGKSHIFYRPWFNVLFSQDILELIIVKKIGYRF